MAGEVAGYGPARGAQLDDRLFFDYRMTITHNFETCSASPRARNSRFARRNSTASDDMPEQQQLAARYSAAGDHKDFALPLPAVPADGADVDTKTAYLSELRANASKLQGEINVFLTQKMEDDKAAEGGSKKKSAAEEREEQMYGEEDPENDG
jgi:hypothetical protein